MDPMVRRNAKAINFGIIYGISAFGLANNLGIGRDEAKAYIDSYFKKFPGIAAYMDAMRSRGERHRPCRDDLRPAHPPARHQGQEPVGPSIRRAPGDQRADSGCGRRHHAPGHDPHGRGAQRIRT
jgi:hypothetical protein